MIINNKNKARVKTILNQLEDSEYTFYSFPLLHDIGYWAQDGKEIRKYLKELGFVKSRSVDAGIECKILNKDEHVVFLVNNIILFERCYKALEEINGLTDPYIIFNKLYEILLNHDY